MSPNNARSMCGIAGIVDLRGQVLPTDGLAREMARRLVHRGPDGEGNYQDGPAAISFRRLAVIDPSAPSGPYTDESGTIISAVNGEIYNYPELLERLRSRGHVLRTGCDTEVVSHLYEEAGVELVEKLDGMFAVAVWDGRARRLLLARDRAGEKPLYYAISGGKLLFASELQAILASPDVSRDLDAGALAAYLQHDHYPSPTTPFRQIRKLPAGHVLVADSAGVRIRRYWSLAESWEAPPREETAAALREELLTLLRESLVRRWRSDVPVGIFLSGGVDSSSILALLARESVGTIRTFTLGFEDREFNEAARARETARGFGAEHHEEIVGFSGLAGALGHVAPRMADPLADPSLLPAWLITRLARRDVTVVLSGEGSDELFGGYPTYPGHLIAARLARLPSPAAGALSLLVRLLPVSHGNVTLDFLARQLVAGAGLDTLTRHLGWFGSIPASLQARLVTREFRESADEWNPQAAARACTEGIRFRDELSRVMHLDISTYLQDGLLTKMDRASMMHSLEVRTPFLDHHLMEFAARLPSRLKVRGPRTKVLLRDSLRHVLPAEVLTRRKRGFSFPVARWIDGEGRGLVAELLGEERLRKQGIFEPSTVRSLLAEHVMRRADNRRPIWNLLLFQLWHRHHVESPVPMALPVAKAASVTST